MKNFRTGRSTVMSVPSSNSTLHSRCPFFPTAAESIWSAADRCIPRPVRRRLRNRINRDIAARRPTPSDGSCRSLAVLMKKVSVNDYTETSSYKHYTLTARRANKQLPAYINPAHLLPSGQSRLTQSYAKKLNSAQQAYKHSKYYGRRRFYYLLLVDDGLGSFSFKCPTRCLHRDVS